MAYQDPDALLGSNSSEAFQSGLIVPIAYQGAGQQGSILPGSISSLPMREAPASSRTALAMSQGLLPSQAEGSDISGEVAPPNLWNMIKNYRLGEPSDLKFQYQKYVNEAARPVIIGLQDEFSKARDAGNYDRMEKVALGVANVASRAPQFGDAAQKMMNEVGERRSKREANNAYIDILSKHAENDIPTFIKLQELKSQSHKLSFEVLKDAVDKILPNVVLSAGDVTKIHKLTGDIERKTLPAAMEVKDIPEQIKKAHALAMARNPDAGLLSLEKYAELQTKINRDEPIRPSELQSLNTTRRLAQDELRIATASERMPLLPGMDKFYNGPTDPRTQDVTGTGILSPQQSQQPQPGLPQRPMMPRPGIARPSGASGPIQVSPGEYGGISSGSTFQLTPELIRKHIPGVSEDMIPAIMQSRQAQEAIARKEALTQADARTTYNVPPPTPKAGEGHAEFAARAESYLQAKKAFEKKAAESIAGGENEYVKQGQAIWGFNPTTGRPELTTGPTTLADVGKKKLRTIAEAEYEQKWLNRYNKNVSQTMDAIEAVKNAPPEAMNKKFTDDLNNALNLLITRGIEIPVKLGALGAYSITIPGAGPTALTAEQAKLWTKLVALGQSALEDFMNPQGKNNRDIETVKSGLVGAFATRDTALNTLKNALESGQQQLIGSFSAIPGAVPEGYKFPEIQMPEPAGQIGAGKAMDNFLEKAIDQKTGIVGSGIQGIKDFVKSFWSSTVEQKTGIPLKAVQELVTKYPDATTVALRDLDKKAQRNKGLGLEDYIGFVKTIQDAMKTTIQGPTQYTTKDHRSYRSRDYRSGPINSKTLRRLNE